MPVLGAAYYVKKKKPELYDSIKARLTPGGKGSFEVSDFYEPADKGPLNKLASRVRRKDLGEVGWQEEMERYTELEKALAAKVDELNRLSTYEASAGDSGKELKAQAYATAKLMNKMEEDYTREALLGGDEEEE